MKLTNVTPDRHIDINIQAHDWWVVDISSEWRVKDEWWFFSNLGLQYLWEISDNIKTDVWLNFYTFVAIKYTDVASSGDLTCSMPSR